MTAEPDGPTLTDSAGRGGINAQDGFDYQTWDAIARIPGWLKQQHFDGVLFEGLEDFEASTSRHTRRTAISSTASKRNRGRCRRTI